jgi:predicted oxidoreductase (fatty acid repression mutant protein)
LNDEHVKAFNLLKDKLCSVLVLASPDFTKTFEGCDASVIGIGAVLMYDRRPLHILVRNFTYVKESYALVRTLETRQH